MRTKWMAPSTIPQFVISANAETQSVILKLGSRVRGNDERECLETSLALCPCARQIVPLCP